MACNLKMVYTLDETEGFVKYLKERIKSRQHILRVDCSKCRITLIVTYNEQPMNFENKDGVGVEKPTVQFKCPFCQSMTFTLYGVKPETLILVDAF